MGKSQLLHRYCLFFSVLITMSGYCGDTRAVEFNTDILDAEDRNNIDLSRFARAGYIMPGTYSLTLRLNERNIIEQEVVFKEKKGADEVQACLTPQQVELLGLKHDALAKISFDHDDDCADFSALDGVRLRGDLSTSSLYISVPQAWLEYQDATWLPPSRWENGVPGVMLDYNINTSFTRPVHGSQSQRASATGTLGANSGPWRLRGDWQANYNKTGGSSGGTTQRIDWSRF